MVLPTLRASSSVALELMPPGPAVHGPPRYRGRGCADDAPNAKGAGARGPGPRASVLAGARSGAHSVRPDDLSDGLRHYYVRIRVPGAVVRVTMRLDATPEALRLAGFGYPVVPVVPRTKAPAFTDWQQQATTNLDTVREWWSGPCHGFGVGIATGLTGLIVVELLINGAVNGPSLWAGMYDDDERPVLSELTAVIAYPNPQHLAVHLYYAGAKDNPPPTRPVLPGVNIYGADGLVLVPPADHPWWQRGAR